MNHLTPEEKLSFLLYDLRQIPSVEPESLARRHEELFSRYVDVEKLCDALKAPSSLLLRAAALSGVEISASETPGAPLYRLKSVFSRLAVGKLTAEQGSYYPNHPLSLDDIFPDSENSVLTGDLLAPLEKDIAALNSNPPRDFPAFLTVLDTLLQRHLWFIPGAAGKDVDVSLYHKMKSTFAIAVCLREESAAQEKPFLLLTADFSGIQNYIFTVARTNSPGTAKRLRARSFLVDEMVQGLAYLICDRMDIPYGNILMMTGGKFNLLLPNRADMEEQLQALRAEIDADLFHRFAGEISVNMAWLSFGEDGLVDYSATVTELAHQLRRGKQKAFHSVLCGETGWKEVPFILFDDLAEKKSCPSCGKSLMPSQRNVCESCEEQEGLGGQLTRAEYLWFARDSGEYKLWEKCWLSLSEEKAGKDLIRVEQINRWTLPASMTHLPLGVRLMANHLPKREMGRTTVPLTFSDLAELANGSKRIAVLKADVDTLGYLFADGMRTPTKHYGTISRISTLSYLLVMFFSGYISHLLDGDYQDVYSVFSGGDDLFLIGPWDRMPQLALEIEEKFRAFCGENPCVTLSAAVCVSSPKVNISLLAENSEQVLKQVKNSAPPKLYPNKSGRNGVSFLNTIFSWEDFKAQLAIMDKLLPVAKGGNISILRRMILYSGMYRQYLLDGDVMGLMFEPLLSYDQFRNYNRLSGPSQSINEFSTYAKNILKGATSKNLSKVNRNLYFAETVITCVLNYTKEER